MPNREKVIAALTNYANWQRRAGFDGTPLIKAIDDAVDMLMDDRRLLEIKDRTIAELQKPTQVVQRITRTNRRTHNE